MNPNKKSSYPDPASNILLNQIQKSNNILGKSFSITANRSFTIVMTTHENFKSEMKTKFFAFAFPAQSSFQEGV